MPITVVALLGFWDIGVLLALEPLARFVTGGAGARPDHPISGHLASDFAVTHNTALTHQRERVW